MKVLKQSYHRTLSFTDFLNLKSLLFIIIAQSFHLYLKSFHSRFTSCKYSLYSFELMSLYLIKVNCTFQPELYTLHLNLHIIFQIILTFLFLSSIKIQGFLFDQFSLVVIQSL